MHETFKTFQHQDLNAPQTLNVQYI